MRKIIAVVMAAAMALAMTACAPAESSSTNTEEDTVNYSYGLTEDGYYEGVSLSDCVKLPENYKEIVVSEADIAPTEEHWEAYRTSVASKIGEKKELTDAAAEDGSFVTIDFVGKVDGKEFTGGSASDIDLQIGSGQYLKEFESGIVGHKAGDTFDVEVVFPEGYGSTTDVDGNEMDLSGKTAVFAITLKSVNEYTLSDEAVADYFSVYNEDKPDDEKVTTIDGMKENFMTDYYNTMLRNTVVNTLTEACNIESVPETVMDAYMHVEMELVEFNAASAGLSAETLVQMNGFESLEAYEEYIKENSINSIKSQLALLAIAEKEGIVYDAESCRDTFQGEPDELIAMYGKGYVSQNVICSKVINMLTEAAVVE